MKYRFHSDPGHGWLEVPIAELSRLSIAEAISPYSYVRGSVAFLEEDVDYSTFVMAYKAKHGAAPDTIDVNYPNDDAPLRNYRGYPANAHWSANAEARIKAYAAARGIPDPFQQVLL